MPGLLSGSVLRSGGSGDFLNLADAMPQLPPTDTTETGFTIATDPVLRTSYRSSLGFVHFHTATMYSILPNGQLTVIATGTTYRAISTSTASFVVQGGVGIGSNLIVEEDSVIHGVRIGTGGPQPGWVGENNIVIRGTATTAINEFNNGQKSIAIGYDVMGGLDTAYKSIAIGTYALNSGSKIANTIAIGDSALKELGWRNSKFLATVTNATQASPVVITANHNLSTGTYVLLQNIVGMTELNQGQFYINRLSTNTFALYSDSILSIPVNGTAYNPYVSGGTVEQILTRRNNIAIGNNAAEKLQDGQKNFFFGDLIAKNLITGSNNIYIGSDVGANITKASGIISIGSDNLVDETDNQVAIGSVFYYNGLGAGTLNANFQVGIGMQSTSTNSGGLTVIGGAGIERNLYVGEKLNVLGTGTSSFFAGNVQVQSVTSASSTVSGSLQVAGGVGIQGNIYAATGEPDENWLLYTPRHTVSTIAPLNPRIGDVWIDPNFAAYFVYVKDGVNKIWLQVGST